MTHIYLNYSCAMIYFNTFTHLNTFSNTYQIVYEFDFKTLSILLYFFSITNRKAKDTITYRETFNKGRTLVDNKIVNHSDVVVGAASTTSSFSTYHLASMDWAKTTAIWGEKHLSFFVWCGLH